MDCRTVMAPIRVHLFADQSVSDVLDFMIEKHMGLVPVVNRDGSFAGMVSGDQLMKFMLPRALNSVISGQNASYLDETATEMQERLDELRTLKVGDVLEVDIDTVNPDTPLIDALMKIKSKQYVVPVVDEDNLLLGAISFFSVLYALREAYDRETAERQKAEERAHRQEGKTAP